MCLLYQNQKPPPDFLFVAAAALYSFTGEAAYRFDADALWPRAPQFSVDQQTFLYNWNNVLTQGAIILSMSPDVAGAQRSREFYREALRISVELWSRCSNEGAASIGRATFCRCSAFRLSCDYGHRCSI